MGLRAKASAFGHPKSPHASAVAQRPFTAALQIIIPRRGGSDPASDDEDCTGGGAPLFFADVSGAIHRRPHDAGEDGGGEGAGRVSGSGSKSRVPDYYAARLTFPQLFDEGFLARHVRAPGAALHSLCVEGRIDRDDIAAITPTGHAHLSLTPRTYARMGVTGAKSDRGAVKFSAVINLANPKFTPGEPFHDRVAEACSRAAEASADAAHREREASNGVGGVGVGVGGGGDGDARWYLCSFESHGAAAEMTFPVETKNKNQDAPPEVEVVRCSFALTSRLVGALEHVPEPPSAGLFGNRGGHCGVGASRMETDDGDGDGDGDEDGDVSSALIEFHEWIGAVSCGCVGKILREEVLNPHRSNPKGSRQRRRKQPEPGDGGGGGGDDDDEGNHAYKADAVETYRWEGLLLPSHASAVLGFCRDAVNSGRAPWAVLTLWGFADDPTPRSLPDGGGGGGGGGGRGGTRGVDYRQTVRGGGDRSGGGGDDDLTFLVLPVDRYVLFSQPPR